MNIFDLLINSETIRQIIKLFIIGIGTIYTANKLNENTKRKNKIIVVILLILISILCGVIKEAAGSFYSNLFLIILLIIDYYIYTNSEMTNCMISIVISITINYVMFFASIIISYIPTQLLEIESKEINLSIITLIYLILIKLFLRIKKFKYGFAFLKEKVSNQYVELLLLNISAVILFTSIIFSESNIILASKLFFGLIIFSIIMFITIQKSLQLYYKQKMLVKELDETKEDLARAENKIKILERENIEESKKRHTVIHKQKSLEYKIEEMLTKTEMSTEEAAEVRERLEKLNKEVYTEKEVMELDKTGISSIDDMLKYMQSECIKNKIDFTLQIKGNIHYMVHNLVKEEELEILLADHIKDAIIAINHTVNANRSILVRLGNIDDIYSLYIYDSGVEFKPEVLENLGKKPCTTYANEGGTGMGFMNTFDTIRKHKSSLIIEEIGKPTEDNYTKVIIIKFDKKNEFKVKSYHEIEKV